MSLFGQVSTAQNVGSSVINGGEDIKGENVANDNNEQAIRSAEPGAADQMNESGINNDLDFRLNEGENVVKPEPPANEPNNGFEDQSDELVDNLGKLRI